MVSSDPAMRVIMEALPMVEAFAGNAIKDGGNVLKTVGALGGVGLLGLTGFKSAHKVRRGTVALVERNGTFESRYRRAHRSLNRRQRPSDPVVVRTTADDGSESTHVYHGIRRQGWSFVSPFRSELVIVNTRERSTHIGQVVVDMADGVQVEASGVFGWRVIDREGEEACLYRSVLKPKDATDLEQSVQGIVTRSITTTLRCHRSDNISLEGLYEAVRGDTLGHLYDYGVELTYVELTQPHHTLAQKLSENHAQFAPFPLQPRTADTQSPQSN